MMEPKRPPWPFGAWPPAWNPFEVFLLGLSVFSSVGLLRGNSGSQVLDERLNALNVALWGMCLLLGSLLALAGVWCYRRTSTLLPGLYLERAGLVLVGSAAAIYSGVVFFNAADVDGVRWTVCIQMAYALACFTRAWQDHRAITRTFQLHRRSRSTAEENGGPR